MYCPLKEAELNVDICPVKCMYRRSNGTCAHNELAYDESLTTQEIAEIRIMPLEEVEREAEEGRKRIRTALVIDAYLGYANPRSVNNEVGEDEHPVFRLFNLPKNKLKTVLSRARYEKWCEMSKVDVSFDEI